MSCKIVRTDKFEDQLNDIIFYIASDSGNIDVALAYLDKVEQAVMRLVDFPEIGTTPRYSLLRRQGYRVLIVERHLVFYKYDSGKKLVTIYAMTDSRREYQNLI